MTVPALLSELVALGYRGAGRISDKELTKLEEIAKIVARQPGAIIAKETSIETAAGKLLTKDSTELYRPMARAYKQIMSELPEGKTVAQAHKDFMTLMTKNNLFGEGAIVATNKRAFNQFLTEQTVVAERQVERGLGTGAKTIPTEDAKLTKLEKNAIEIAKAKAESTISSSLTVMDSVRLNNGKMPKDAFFKELQDSLRTQGLLVVKRDGAATKPAPESVYERIASRQAVSEAEVRSLANYFEKYHNDAQAAAQITNGGGTVVNQRGGIASLLETAIKKLPAPEARTDATLAQNYAWTHGSSNFAINTASRFIERPWRSLGSTAIIGFAGYSALSVAMTLAEPERPWLIAQYGISAITTDKVKGVDDYVEWAANRYNTDTNKAKESFGKYYGIDIEKNSPDEIVAALSGPVKPPYNNLPATTTRALIFYASSKLAFDGPPVDTIAGLINARNETIKRKNEALDRDADTDKAKAGQKEQAIADLKQAARTAGAPEGLLDGLGGANKGGAKSTSEIPPQTSTSYASTLTGDVFKQRLDGMKEEGLLSEDLHTKLASAFKSATRTPVSDAQEFTRANVANGKEISAFARNASEILGQNPAIPKSAINQAVYDLLAPAP